MSWHGLVGQTHISDMSTASVVVSPVAVMNESEIAAGRAIVIVNTCSNTSNISVS